LEEEIRNQIINFALNETMTYPMWRCTCIYLGCDDKTMKDFRDKDSLIALLLHLKHDHVLCNGPKEDVWICLDGDCTWEYKFTAIGERKISTTN
jgi:hypothetical protein